MNHHEMCLVNRKMSEITHLLFSVSSSFSPHPTCRRPSPAGVAGSEPVRPELKAADVQRQHPEGAGGDLRVL